jgi:glycosyltransferase involved in cell wall biosynthesis
LRICYLAQPHSIHTQKWITWFAKKGHEVHLISEYPWGNDKPDEIHLHNLKVITEFRPVRLIYDMIQVNRLLKSIKPDIVHGHYIFIDGILAAFSGFHPFVMTVWGSDILVTPGLSKIYKYLASFTLQKADLITCDAQHLLEATAQLAPVCEKMKLIYFGIDTKRFHPQQKDLSLKQELGFAGDSSIILSTRSFDPIYDVETLIKAIPLISNGFPQARFVFVGDGEQKEYLKNLAEELKVSKLIKFTGRIPNNDIPRYVASADIYVSTSLSDGGIAASTAEAMACELPAVITDFGNNGQWVKDGEGGYLFPRKDPVALAEKVKILLANPDRRQRFGKVNRRVIEQRNSYHCEMQKMESIYKNLMEGNKP